MTNQYSLSVVDYNNSKTWFTYLDPTQQKQVITKLFQYAINYNNRKDLLILNWHLEDQNYLYESEDDNDSDNDSDIYSDCQCQCHKPKPKFRDPRSTQTIRQFCHNRLLCLINDLSLTHLFEFCDDVHLSRLIDDRFKYNIGTIQLDLIDYQIDKDDKDD